MRRKVSPCSLVAAIFEAFAIASCSGAHDSTFLPASKAGAHHLTTAGPIQHIVIVVQENRTVDNLFQNLPGADTQSYGYMGGQQVTLTPEPLNTSWDLSHTHGDFLTDCNMVSETCQMNGWPTTLALSYVPQSDVQPYYTMAEQYAFADAMFSTQQGPSFPAHQYIVRGTSSVQASCGAACPPPMRASENPMGGGCDAAGGVTVINSNGQESFFSSQCFNVPSLFTLLDNAHLSWKYYQSGCGAGYWKAVDALRPIWSNKSEFDADVDCTPGDFLTDVGNGKLAAVTFVTPTASASDHAGQTDGSGPSWVASVVNAVGVSQFWSSTAIFVTWDDWGGFYDHRTPTIYNSFEGGFRVPLIAISPYAQAGYVSHVQHEFGSILKYTEETFNLTSLNTTDARDDDLSDMFNYMQHPIQFKPIQGSNPMRFKKRHDNREVDY